MDAASEAGFHEFVESRSGVLFRTALLLSGGDRGAAEDLLQNALIKAAGRWQRIDEPEAYVRQVLYRQQISRWRLRWRSREQVVAEPPEPGRAAAGGDPVHDAELRIVMARALRRLTTRQRTMLVLRYYEDLPEGEVAALLGCSVGTVRSTTRRSLDKLRAMSPELASLALDPPGTPEPVREQQLTEVKP
ncbi:SigE family RNA polymerase sigma factor [Streptomyces phytophilus]|uniref:SigE family RNA polymerase sigma factor n=1 Tax=Streptomyces phytophilus TaxID=722715 RepID=UPI0015EFE8E6|nr:SigE family RNA polymerase sigma factor [Streptomyces phytophilus]